MTRKQKNFDHLVGNIAGFSEKQWRAHFELYQGYVKKQNEIEEKLKTADPKTANYSYGEISELLRRRSVAYNGARLHELFFENLTGKKTEPEEGLLLAMNRDFGSLKVWLEQMRAGLVSEPGWLLLSRSREDGTLRSDLLEEHHIGVLVEHDIILAFDGWEHAYFIDYATNKADYAATLERSINWDIASKRFENAQVIADTYAA